MHRIITSVLGHSKNCSVYYALGQKNGNSWLLKRLFLVNVLHSCLTRTTSCFFRRKMFTFLNQATARSTLENFYYRFSHDSVYTRLFIYLFVSARGRGATSSSFREGQYSWNSTWWRHRAYSTVVQLFCKRSHIIIIYFCPQTRSP